MNRRTVLASIAGGLSITAGCVEDPARGGNGDENGGDLAPVAEDLVDWRLSLDVDDGPDESPQVAFGQDTVSVTGRITYGSSTCKTVEATTVEYDKDAARLDVVCEDVETEDDSPDDEPRICTDDIASTAYELTADFDDGIPETVRAVEDALEERREATFDRDGVMDRTSDDTDDADHGIDPLPEGIADVTLDLDRGTFEEAKEPPTVDLREYDVTVEGSLVVGSSSCKTTEVTELEFDQEADELDVTVADVEVDLDGEYECTADESIDAYLLRVEFEDRAPSAASVTEDGKHGTRAVGVAEDSASEADVDEDGDYEDSSGTGESGS